MDQFFENGQIVLFQGDSVTDCGRNRRNRDGSLGGITPRNMALGSGYPLKIKLMYDILYKENKVRFINRAVSGDRARNLVERYERDVKAVRPDFMSVLIGVNDTWRRYDSNDPTTAEQFRSDYDTFLDMVKADFPDIGLLIIEPFAFTQHPDRLGWDGDLGEKRAVSKELAEKYGAYFMPAHDIMQENLEHFDLFALSPDGVHPAPQGHAVLATSYMKTLGII